MNSNLVSITGIGSVSPYGTVPGAVTPRPLQPCPITAWPVGGVRRAYLVPPFRPADVVPGLKTRRLDRLSIWSLVAATLAVKDAGLELDRTDRSRVAVVCATGLGCIELTESFLASAADHGWAQTDPILFPETLGNAPASHVARVLELYGPNVTLNSKGQGGEWALLQAASLLRHGQADMAIVIAGDTLTRTAYEWYEAAGRLSSACFDMQPATEGCGFIPAEAVTAMVLERADSPRVTRRYGSLRRACQTIQRHALDSSAETADATVAEAGNVVRGLGDTGALLRLAMALSAAPAGKLLSLAATPSNRSFASLLVEVK